MTFLQEHVCSHCGISFKWKPLEVDSDGSLRTIFCCRGCQGAYSLICGAGLAQFYQRSDRSTPTVPETNVTSFTEADLSQHIVSERDFCRIDILVNGIACPSCIWLLERMVGGIPGVEHVSISYSGGIASLRFDPNLVGPLEIFSLITRLGYTPRPYSPEQSEKADRRERDDMLLRLGTALFLTMQLMAYSYALYAGYFQGMAPGMKLFLQYVSLCVTTPVVFYSGWPFLLGGWRSIKTRAPGMDLLIAVGAISAWSYSLWATFAGKETYFESAAMIVTFVLIGRLLELSVRRKAMSGISALYASVPQRATITGEGGNREVGVIDVRPGDLLLVRQGERFPVDCLVVEGSTEVDQSLVTGESVPVILLIGDEVRSGCINIGQPVTAQALRPVGQSYMMRVAALVQMAQAGKPKMQLLADKVASRFVPTVIILALMVGISRFVFSGADIGASVMTALSVVLIACPCAMGLAVPAAVLAACSRSATLGIILRGGDVIERLADIKIALFDKTGTITRGQPTVFRFECYNGHSEAEVVQAAATVEELVTHPLAKAIVQHASEQGILPESCRDFSSVPGRGISATLTDGRRVLCGSPLFMAEKGLPASSSSELDRISATPVLVVIEDKLAGWYLLLDQLRDGAEALVADLGSQNIDFRLISGDDPAAVMRVAAEIGVSSANGGMTPAEKLSYVRSLQEQGDAVLMVGDGVNDAPALAAAGVSCSLTGSSDIALENADVIITGGDISKIATAYRISRATMSVIKQNLAWAFMYNLIGIPLAMSGQLTPVYAAVAMAASSLFVSINSLRLMRFKHRG